LGVRYVGFTQEIDDAVAKGITKRLRERFGPHGSFRKKMARVTDPHVQRDEKICILWSKKNKYIQAVKVLLVYLCR
jgi:hypothetical protein